MATGSSGKIRLQTGYSSGLRDTINDAGQVGTHSTTAADAPWRARAAWLQAQTNGDPAAELYKSSIPLGRAAGMGGLGPDSSAYQDSYGKDAAALAKSTAKEAVARKAQVGSVLQACQIEAAVAGSLVGLCLQMARWPNLESLAAARQACNAASLPMRQLPGRGPRP